MSAEAGTAAPPPPKGVVPPTEPGGRSGFLSDVIVELGFATPDAVEEAVREARSGSTVAQVLVESGAISEEQLARATAERYGIAYIDLENYEVDSSAAAMIKPSAAKRYQAVPVGFVGGGLLVAMADPADSLGVNDIAVMTKLEVQPAVAPRPALDALLDKLTVLDEGADGATGDEEGAKKSKSAPSTAVFWQADAEEGAGQEQDLPPVQSAPVERTVDPGETEHMRAELVELRRKLVGAETELVKARADLSASQEELTAARGPSAEQEQLQAELAEARAAAESASAQVEELRSRISAMEAELAEQRESAARARPRSTRPSWPQSAEAAERGRRHRGRARSRARGGRRQGWCRVRVAGRARGCARQGRRRRGRA